MTGAQPATDPFEQVSVDSVGKSLPGTVASPVMSDTARVVAFEVRAVAEPGAPAEVDAPTGDATATPRVWIRDRDEATTRPVFERHSGAPGLSGDGCTVAYSVPFTDEGGTKMVALTVVDRCDVADPDSDEAAADVDGVLPMGTIVGTAELVVSPLGAEAPAFSAPALSFDGSVIAWSTGQEIRRYERPDDGMIAEPPETEAAGIAVEQRLFDSGSTPTDDVMTGARIDMSADGNTVAFVAGPGSHAYEPVPANVYVWSLSADDPDPDPDPELVSQTAAGKAGSEDSTSPSLSADGSYVVFESSALDLAAVGVAKPMPPFVVRVARMPAIDDPTERIAQVLADDASAPTVSADGNHVVYVSGTAIRVWSATPTRPDDRIEALDAADPSGMVSISEAGHVIVFASASPLTTDIAQAESASTVWAVDLGALDRVTDTTTTTTVVPESTTPAGTEPPTGPTGTVPATTVPATPFVPEFHDSVSSFPPVTYSSRPHRPTTTTYQPAPHRPTTYPSYPSTFDASGAPSISTVAFDATVVDAGRRAGSMMLTNSTRSAITVVASSVTPPDAFQVTGDNCTGTTVDAGSSCEVEVTFAPTTVGYTTASLMIMLSDGTVVSASLAGEGSAQPTLDLLPAVAGSGQTVTVFGAGFEPGSSVELIRGGTRGPEVVTVEADGTFAHVVVVLPNTPIGPLVLAVPGQIDRFAETTAELLVSARGTASGDAALRSVVGNPIGR